MQKQQNMGKRNMLGILGSSLKLGIEIRDVGTEPERKNSR